MLITLCLIILGYMIVGKDVKPWVEKLKSVDWKSKAHKVIGKIKEYAVKAGRVAVRPLLQFILSILEKSVCNVFMRFPFVS